MQLFRNIKNSVYGIQYYHELLLKPFSYSLKYYFSLVLLVSFITAVFFSISVIPQVKLFLDSVDNKILAYYPSELTIDIKNGEVSTNVSEPYFIKMPGEFQNSEDLKINGSDVGNIENLLVINTKDNFTIEQFKAYDTVFLLTKDGLVSSGENGTISIEPLDKISNLTVNKTNVEFIINKIKPFLGLIYPALFLAIFIGSVFILMFKLVYLLFGAFLIWIVTVVKKMKIGYGKSYQLGIHIMTAGILIGGAINLFRFYIKPFSTFPFFFTVILIIVAVVNIKKIEPLPIT